MRGDAKGVFLRSRFFLLLDNLSDMVCMSAKKDWLQGSRTAISVFIGLELPYSADFVRVRS
jgi:hypothetical protein